MLFAPFSFTAFYSTTSLLLLQTNAAQLISKELCSIVASLGQAGMVEWIKLSFLMLYNVGSNLRSYVLTNTSSLPTCHEAPLVLGSDILENLGWDYEKIKMLYVLDTFCKKPQKDFLFLFHLTLCSW